MHEPMRAGRMWRRARAVCLVAAFLAARGLSWSFPDPLPTQWPLEPVAKDHTLMATFEFKSSVYTDFVHRGIDIAAPMDKNGATGVFQRPIVRVARAGEFMCSGVDDKGITVVLKCGEEFDRYAHLDPLSILPPFGPTAACDIYDPEIPSTPIAVAAGRQIGRVIDWANDCQPDGTLSTGDWSHLHYDIRQVALPKRYRSPLPGFSALSDKTPPRIDEVALCGDDFGLQPATPDWSDCVVPGTACAKVSGRRDLVVTVSDRYEGDGTQATATALQPRRVDYAICDENHAGCPLTGSTSDLLEMPQAWATFATDGAWTFYSARDQKKSKGYNADGIRCHDDRFVVTLTNDQPGGPRRSGTWDTTTVPDGFYSITVEAMDFAHKAMTAAGAWDGNTTRVTLPVCVDNDGTGEGKLLVRDCDGDTGVEPSPCSGIDVTPDIVLNPFDPAHKGTLVSGLNDIQVCMRNVGTGGIDGPVTVAVDVAMPGSFPPHPVPAGIGSVAATVTQSIGSFMDRGGFYFLGGPWFPGQERCTVLDWMRPASGAFHTPSFIARAERTGDAPSSLPGPFLDNNRAQRTLTLIDWTELKKLMHVRREPWFYVNPLDIYAARNVVLDFDWDGLDPDRVRIQVSVGPGASFERVDGTAVVGAYDAARKPEPDAARPFAWRDLVSTETACPEAVRTGTSSCWQVLGDTPARGTITLEGLQAREPAPVNIAVFGVDAETPGTLRITVRESGIRSPEGRREDIGSLQFIVEPRGGAGKGETASNGADATPEP